MIHRIAAALVLMILCGVALAAGPPKSEEGSWVLAAHDDAGRVGEQPHVKSEFDWWIKPEEMNSAPPNDARLLTFAVGNSVTCRYAALNPKSTYKVRLIFFNVVHKRVVKTSVNGKQLATDIDLPIEKTLVKEFELDAAMVADGAAEVRVDIVAGRSAILSAAELWRKGEVKEPAKNEEVKEVAKTEETRATPDKPQAASAAVVDEAEPTKPQAAAPPVAAPAPAPVAAVVAAAMVAEDVTESTTPIDGKGRMMGAIVPAPGDTFVFIGDSITHNWVSGAMYTQYIENFFITRYPNTPMHFYNAGVSGSKVEGAITRFEMDIAAQKPKYVSVLLGMNDAGYQPFDRAVFERFAGNMRTLLDRLAGVGSRAVAVSPTWFDYRGVELNPKGDAALRAKFREYDATMAFYGAWLRDEANARGIGWANVHGVMSGVVAKQRRIDPKFTLAGDSIHPEAPGNAVIAAAILEQIQDSRHVSEISATRSKGGWDVKSDDGLIANSHALGEGVVFSFTVRSLPWVLPAEAMAGLKLVDGSSRLSLEVLRVVGLAPGKYELKIDGESVGTWSESEFAQGVELQDNEKTPQYKQAAAVMELNRERNAKPVHEMRKMFEATKGLPSAAAVAKCDAVSREYEKNLYVAARPVVRKYEIVAGK